jgi:hypothetical protein
MLAFLVATLPVPLMRKARPRSPLPLLRPTNGSDADTLLTETSQTRCSLRIRLDFCRKGRIAMCAGRLTCSPAGALRARPATCGALGRASVNSDAANQRSPNPCRPFHREIPEPQERRTQEGERQIERDIPAQDHVRRGQRQDAVES